MAGLIVNTSLINSNEDRRDGSHRVLVESAVQKLFNDILKPYSPQDTIVKHPEKCAEEFLGRKWLLKDVDDWLADPKDDRVYWLEAEAGFGKSAFSTKLAQTKNVAALAFCSSAMVSNQDDFAKNLVRQLITQVKEFKTWFEESWFNALFGVWG